MPTTHAIRFKQTEEEKAAGVVPLYVTYDAQFKTGYGYCCPCKETKQFPSKQAALHALDKIEPEQPGRERCHEVIDSETAAKEKAARTRKKSKA